MQHTTKYQLNLIEPSDEFSPDPLNQNTQKVEDELARRPCIVYGTYTGTGEYGPEHPCKLEFDFKPLIFIPYSTGTYNSTGHVWTYGIKKGIIYEVSDSVFLANISWTENSVSWYSTDSVGDQLNSKGIEHPYIAIGLR